MNERFVAIKDVACAIHELAVIVWSRRIEIHVRSPKRLIARVAINRDASRSHNHDVNQSDDENPRNRIRERIRMIP